MMTSRIASLAALTAAGICLTAYSGAPAPALNTSPPPVSVTPPPVPSAPPTAMQDWCSGNGYDAWSSVGADVAKVHADSGGDDLTALAADGGQLSADAAAAAGDLPPFGKDHRIDYLFAMTALRVAGGSIVDGDFGAASKDMNLADGYVSDVGPLVTSSCLGG